MSGITVIQNVPIVHGYRATESEPPLTRDRICTLCRHYCHRVPNRASLLGATRGHRLPQKAHTQKQFSVVLCKRMLVFGFFLVFTFSCLEF